jgi:ABC-type multidrug transport system fused ATPase/permease subunit
MAQKQNDVVAMASEAVQNYRLIADFNLRPFMVDSYEVKVNHYNTSEAKFTTVLTHNTYLPPWLTTVLVGGYMAIAPFQVETLGLGGKLSLGAFLATINIFKEVGIELAEIYKEFMEIQKSVGPLRKVSHYMNLETDVRARMNINRMRRAQGGEKRLEARSKAETAGGSQVLQTDSGHRVFAIDLVNIEIQNLTYHFDERKVLRNVNATFPQGRLYAFIGPPHQGKSTLLRLIGSVLLPNETSGGSIFVPPHLRVLHLSQETFFLGTTLLRNIVFNSNMEKVGGLSRIRKICEQLRFPESMLAHLHVEQEPTEMSARADAFRAWVSLLSYTDYARINLARAFVMNPECLVLHKPALAFDDNEARLIIQLLRAHVDERGLELSEEGRHFRRNRTVFFTAASMDAIEHADRIYEVSTDHGTLPVSSDQALRNLQIW